MVVTAALNGVHGLDLAPIDMVRVARDAEWYAGARVGVSDQGALALGRRDHLLHVAFPVDRIEEARPHWMPFPDDLAVLVVHSHTRRSLSGAHAVAYALNRCAYSIALDVARHVLRGLGVAEPLIQDVRGLADLAPRSRGGVPDLSTLYTLLLSIPESIEIETLKGEYPLPGFAAAWTQYFGGVPESQWPTRLSLRGPLVFGIAESERARLFAQALEQGVGATAGRLMCWGHDGDRLVDKTGRRFKIDMSDHAVRRLADGPAPIEACPGAYGASSPALDGLVDAAMAGGALGASLTGAGLAGSVLALCRKNDTEAVSQALARTLQSDSFARRAGWTKPLDPETASCSVVVNQAPAGVGEFAFSGFLS